MVLPGIIHNPAATVVVQYTTSLLLQLKVGESSSVLATVLKVCDTVMPDGGV